MDFTIEELAMGAWPAIKTCFYDGWVIRLANGYCNRANSINMIYPSKIKMEEKLNYCDEIFMRHNLPVAYKIAGCDEHKAIEQKLDELRYQKINETAVQVCDISAISKANYEGIIIRDEFDNQWKDSVIDFNRIEEKHIATFKKIIDSIAMEKIVVRKETGGKIAGCGYGVIGSGYVGVFDIVVNEKHRGKGYGREIVETIMSEAGKRGVRKSFLQVMINNPIAMKLYEKMGYRELYRYWYRKKG